MREEKRGIQCDSHLTVSRQERRADGSLLFLFQGVDHALAHSYLSQRLPDCAINPPRKKSPEPSCAASCPIPVTQSGIKFILLRAVALAMGEERKWDLVSLPVC